MQHHPKIFIDNQGALHLNAGAYGTTIAVACCSPDGARLLTVREVGIARVWDVATGICVGEIHSRSPLEGTSAGPTTAPFQLFIEAAALSPDGTLALLGLNDGTAGVFDVATRARTSTLAAPDEEPAARWGVVRAVAYAPDGQTVAVGFGNGRVGLWDGRGERLRATPHHAHPHALPFNRGPRPALISSLTFGSDGRHLFASASDGSVTIWDLQTAIPVFHAAEHTQQLIALALLDDGVRWATDQGAVWEARDGRRAERLRAGGEVWDEAVFSPDGTRLLARTRWEVQEWTLGGELRRTPLGSRLTHWANATLLAFAPDGSAATLPLGATRRLLVNGAEEHELVQLRKDEDVLFTPCGSRLLTRTAANLLCTWSRTGTLLSQLRLTGSVGALAVSPDEALVAVGVLGNGGPAPYAPSASGRSTAPSRAGRCWGTPIRSNASRLAPTAAGS